MGYASVTALLLSNTLIPTDFDSTSSKRRPAGRSNT